VNGLGGVARGPRKPRPSLDLRTLRLIGASYGVGVTFVCAPERRSRHRRRNSRRLLVAHFRQALRPFELIGAPSGS